MTVNRGMSRTGSLRRWSTALLACAAAVLGGPNRAEAINLRQGVMGERDALSIALPAAPSATHRRAGPDALDGHRGVHALRPATLEAIGATDAQRAQIEEIVQSASTDLAVIGAKRQLLDQQELALRSQHKVDADRLHAIRTQQLQLADASTTRWKQAIAAAARVLTPAQRAAIDQLGP
ncbi:MAG: hypothetical protein ACM3PU_08460 [Gemmatimonadota bacterium]